MEDNHSSVQGRDSAGISYCYKNMGLDEFGSVEILNLKERITFEYSIRDEGSESVGKDKNAERFGRKDADRCKYNAA